MKTKLTILLTILTIVNTAVFAADNWKEKLQKELPLLGHPECGDWYARNMYLQGSRDYKSHLEECGHPSTNGCKDVSHRCQSQARERQAPGPTLHPSAERSMSYFARI